MWYTHIYTYSGLQTFSTSRLISIFQIQEVKNEVEQEAVAIPHTPRLLPLSYQLLSIAKLINCESWQIRTLLKFKTETWGQEISILYYLEYIITDRLAGIWFLPAIKWDSQIMSWQPSCLWWYDMPFGKGRTIRCDTAWHPSAFWCCSMPWWTEEMWSGQIPSRMGGKLFWNSDYLVVPGQNTMISSSRASTQHDSIFYCWTVFSGTDWMLEEGVLLKCRKYTKIRKTRRQAGDSAWVLHGGDLGPKTQAVMSIMEVELARQEGLLSLDLAPVKPKQECCLVLGGSSIAFQSSSLC